MTHFSRGKIFQKKVLRRIRSLIQHRWALSKELNRAEENQMGCLSEFHLC